MTRAILAAAFLGLAACAAAAHSPAERARPPTREELLAGDPQRGADTFQNACAACHTIEKGGRRRVGPNLFAVVGARIAQRDGYPYTAAFRKADITWDEETLGEFLAAPAIVVPGTKMDWALSDTKAIADVISYLRGIH
jgi:cytochrome c